MPLHNPNELTERIELFGYPGTSKSYSWLTIAKWAQKTGSRAKFYCIDTDNSVKRALSRTFKELNNVEYSSCFTWDQVTKETDKFLEKIKPNDWF
ncbi:MAG: hypothetical protein QXU18_09830, partial [Thermoplasmatales archaeon]